MKRSGRACSDLAAMAAEAKPMFAPRRNAAIAEGDSVFEVELLKAYVTLGDEEEDTEAAAPVGLDLDFGEAWAAKAEDPSPCPSIDWLLKSVRTKRKSPTEDTMFLAAAEEPDSKRPVHGDGIRASWEKRTRLTPEPHEGAASGMEGVHSTEGGSGDGSSTGAGGGACSAGVPAASSGFQSSSSSSLNSSSSSSSISEDPSPRAIAPLAVPTALSGREVPVLALPHPAVSRAAQQSARQNHQRGAFFIVSLREKLRNLWDENQKLKDCALEHLPKEVSKELLNDCISDEPSILTDGESSEFADTVGFMETAVLMKVLKDAQVSVCVTIAPPPAPSPAHPCPDLTRQRSYVITDPKQTDNPIVWVSPSFCKMTGYDRSEIIGRNCRFLQGPETDQVIVSKIRKAVAEKYPESVTIINYKRDGTPFWNNLYVSPLFDRFQNVTHYVGVQCDVTASHISKLTAPADRIPVSWQAGGLSSELRTGNGDGRRVSDPVTGYQRSISPAIDQIRFISPQRDQGRTQHVAP